MAYLLLRLLRPYSRSAYNSIYRYILLQRGVVFHGSPGYMDTKAFFDTTETIEIGHGTVITAGVRILTHDYSITPAADYVGLLGDNDLNITGKVKIGAQCFLGLTSILLPGTTIGDGVIVGAGSVVRGNIPPNTIIVGNPAKIVGQTDSWVRNKILNKSSHHNIIKTSPKTDRTN